MPGKTKLDRCVEDVMKKGHSKDSAYAICQASIKQGVIVEKLDVQKGQEQTIEGVDGTQYTVKSDGVYVTKKAKLGSGARFKKVEEEAKESGAKDPAGVAAAAGRKKYGKKRFQEMAEAGKKHAKKATVLKSLRTVGGANDWVKIMKSYYPEAVVVDNDTLKAYGEVAWEEPTGQIAVPHHVVIEEDLTPVIETIKKGDVISVIRAMIDKGFMEVTDYGSISFTTKWNSILDKFIQDAISDATKSANDGEVELRPELISSIAVEVFDNFANILKSLEDSERLAHAALPPEEFETGHKLRPNQPISDEEVRHDQQVNSGGHVPPANTEDKMAMPEPLSQEEVHTQVHAHDHNAGKEVRGQPGKDIEGQEISVGSKGSTSTKSAVLKAIMSPSAAQGTAAPEKVDDHATQHAKEVRDAEVDAKKTMTPDDLNSEFLSHEEAQSQKSLMNTVFKSLGEARAWEARLASDLREVWHVVPTSFEDKKTLGRRYAYIVKSRAPTKRTGAFGNKLP